MTPDERENHVRFLRLYVENEEALRGSVRSQVPTLEDVREVMQETVARAGQWCGSRSSPGRLARRGRAWRIACSDRHLL